MPARKSHRPSQRKLLLRARLILPVTGPPIPNGAVLVRGAQVAQVGKWTDFAGITSSNVFDLGECILMPGLVNAHCHLDYTDMAGMIPPQKSFTDWIKLILAAKAEWNYSEFAASWLNGAGMLLRTGTTTVGDFETIPELLPDVWSATPLRVMSFLELTSVRRRRNPRKLIAEAVERIESLPPGRSRAALAPHSPYSTVPELLHLAAATSRKNRWPLSVHLSESRQEFDMIARGKGEMFEWLKRNERDMTDCGLGSPVAHLNRAGGLGRNLLAVHVNYLAPGDAALLARRQVSVAHCPRSHHYFQHARFPYEKLTRAGVNVCLGTDSLASVYKTRRQQVELDMFEEMRAFSAAWPKVSSRTIISLATVNGARALGLERKAGEISRGAFADLIAIPFTGRTAEAFDAVLDHRTGIASGMIHGEWAVPPA